MFNIFYEDDGETKSYCMCSMPYEKAVEVLTAFQRRYLDENGKGKIYPNGKGYYPITNPRIERV